MSYWPSLFVQDGWILANFFSCVFMDRDEVEEIFFPKSTDLTRMQEMKKARADETKEKPH